MIIKTAKYFLIVAILVMVGGFVFFYWPDNASDKYAPKDDESKKEIILPKDDLIRIDNLKPGDTLKSPAKITGQARGYWFFEASFPVRVVNDNGQEMKVAIATAQSDWMTEEFVPFEVVLEFDTPNTKNGLVIFKKDNPSGLPEHDDSLVVPVFFNE